MPRIDSCPICGKPASPAQAPFCSQGCRDRDLLQWLGEGYRIPAGPADPEDPEARPSTRPGLDSAEDAD